MSTEDRQKQIDIIARSFSMQSHAGDPRSFSEGIELGFKAGAAWADRNTANKWHDTSEEPNKYEYILFEYISNKNELKYFAYYVTPFGNVLHEFEKFGKCRWAYISDLLPKGGKR